ILDVFRSEIRVARERFVHLVDIRLVMLCVMDFHRPSVNVRLERVIIIIQFWKLVCHIFCFPSNFPLWSEQKLRSYHSKSIGVNLSATGIPFLTKKGL